MEKLKNIDKEITKLLESISDDDLKHMEFLGEIEFNLNDDVFDETYFKNRNRINGIYFLQIANVDNVSKFDFNKFEERWSDEHKPSPKIVKERFKMTKSNSQNQTWIPLYVGKSENLFYRVLNNHIKECRSDCKTSSLKLMARKEELKMYKFKFSFYEIEKLENYEIISTLLERKFREKYHPILGKH